MEKQRRAACDFQQRDRASGQVRQRNAHFCQKVAEGHQQFEGASAQKNRATRGSNHFLNAKLGRRSHKFDSVKEERCIIKALRPITLYLVVAGSWNFVAYRVLESGVKIPTLVAPILFMFALLLAFLVAFGGTLLTYLYDQTSPLMVRAAIGICTSFALFATLTFALACILGLNAASILLSSAILAIPVFLTRAVWREGLRRDITQATRRDIEYSKSGAPNTTSPLVRWVEIIVLGLLLCVLAWAMSRVSYEKPDGLYTAYETNIGDLTLHFQIMTGFAWGGNYPPQSPIYAGSLFVYPFLPDFLTAIWLRLGASFPFAVVMQTEMLAFAMAILLHRLSLELVRDRLAALIAPYLVIFTGGLGWIAFISDSSDSATGFREVLAHMPRQYTNAIATWRWCNALTTLFVTQRSLMLGLPLALVVFLLWWRFFTGRNQLEGGQRPRFHPLLAAGFLVSMLPLIHSHTFLVVALTSVYLAFLIQPLGAGAKRDWQFYFVALAPIAAIELAYYFFARHSQAKIVPGAFFAWNFGWDKGDANIFVFWLQNTGAFWPLIFYVLWKRKDSRAALKRFSFFWIPLLALNLVSRETGIFDPLGLHARVALYLRVLVAFYFALVPFIVARCWPRTKDENREGENWAWQDVEWRNAALWLSVFVTIGFVMPNLFRFAPWIWDNNKILIYWFVIASPFASLGLAHLWRARHWRRGLAAFLFFTLTAAGALDIWHGANGQLEQRNFDRDGIALASVMRDLPRGTVVLHAPIYNSPICLSGKISVMGYNGHLASYGIDYGTRETDVQSFLRGDAGSDRVLEKYGATAFIIGPQERDYLAHLNPPQMLAPPEYWNKWKKVTQQGEYTLYTTR